MVDVSTVLDAAAGVAAGKVDPGVAGQGGKAAASFFAVLAARMAPAGDANGVEAALPLGVGVEPVAGGNALSAKETANGLPAQEVASEVAADGVLDPAAYPALAAAMNGQPVAAASGQAPAASSTGPVSATPGAAVPQSASLQGTSARASAQMAAEDTPPQSAPAPATGLPETAKTRADLSRYPADGLARAANPAADAAMKGQALPQSLAANVASQSAAGAALAREGIVDALAAVSASTTTGPGGTAALVPTTGSVLTDPAMSRLFDVLPRQIEGRLNVAIEAPFRSPAFASELGEKIVWLAGRHAQFAELSLNPPHLGALEVRLSVSGGEAVAQFFSANAGVRDALETAMPRLRELMAQAGINLGEAQVRDEAFARDEAARGELRTSAGASTQASEEMAARALPMRGMGLVDLYV
ncbi:MAG: flagellar hook-length control protein FliK [bacterium]|nr:MAG: flagellar hook-length control protein FliK [bacterium]KAF0149229.1 MAG: flagellar hook-length control protein FliK [bacterium]KAF0168866.1 MAG: flagellar hook-length control protein FliK [bacterium]TXT20072.1 MAG: flagellar hook-length control protein FliK [bacterium]